MADRITVLLSALPRLSIARTMKSYDFPSTSPVTQAVRFDVVWSGPPKSNEVPLRVTYTKYVIGKDGSAFEAGVSGSTASDQASLTAPPVLSSAAEVRPAKVGAFRSNGLVGIAERDTVFVS